MLAYFEFRFLGLGQQIANSLIVYFEHADLDLKRTGSILVGFDLLEDAVANDGNEPLVGTVADHRVALPRTRLAVSEQATVIAFPALLRKYQALTRILEPIWS